MSSSPRVSAVDSGFAAVRAEFDLPALDDSDAFPADVLAEAEAASRDGVPGADRDRIDATDLALVTIDPPGSRDLDQALLVQPRGDGWRVYYAIADLGAVVTPGGALDAEVHRRGQTLYLPDRRIPLHPAVLSEGVASLLPGETRRAALWTIDLDAAGEPVSVDVRRAIVRSTAQLTYRQVQDDLDAGRVHPSVAALPDVGRLREAAALRRGAVELGLPEQEVVTDSDGRRGLVLRRRTDVDGWNAEISLLTGMCAAQLMLDARVGLLRTLPAPEPEAIAALRRTAIDLGIDWPVGTTPAQILAALDPADPRALAVMTGATRLLRGAGYVAFDGEAPQESFHGGIGAPYTHVTAPLRRLVDRFTTEACLATVAGVEVPSWVRDALPELPAVMGGSDATAAKVERACLSQVEAEVLVDRIGETFPAIVLRADDESGEVLIADPPVTARCSGVLPQGQRVDVRLVTADPVTRTVEFAL